MPRMSSALAALGPLIFTTACIDRVGSMPDPGEFADMPADAAPPPECLTDADCGADAVCDEGVCRPGVRCMGEVDAPCNGCPVDTVVPSGWVCAPAGVFEMGADAAHAVGRHDFPPRTVELTQPILVRAHPVTRAEWRAVFPELPPVPAEFDTCVEPSCPVTMVSWWDAAAYLDARSRAAGRAPCYRLADCDGRPGHDFECSDPPWRIDGCDGHRLPTEAEREAFTRAGTRTPYWSGSDEDDLAAVGWYRDNADRRVRPVCAPPTAGRAHNPWGLCDVHGNVLGWTESGYGPYPDAPADGSPLRDPRGDPSALTMAMRGGSVHWPAFALHAAWRVDFPPAYRTSDVGFRPVRPVGRPAR